MLLLAITLLLPAHAATVEVARVDGANLQRPSWSPDGAQLSWEANFHERKEIELYVGAPGAPARRIQPPGSAPSALTAGFTSGRPAGAVAHELAWSPPSMGRFVFTASNALQDYDLYIAGGSALAPAPGADGGAAWSPDGRFIAFTSARTGQGDLYLLDVHRIEAPPRQLTSAPTSSELFAAWSPDSAGLVYVAHSKSGDNLWLLPTLDSAPVQLTTWGGNQVRPSFSPDGALVAFYANHEEPTRFDLYVVVPEAGATPRKLLEGVLAGGHSPRWTPDGAHLVVVLDDDAAFDPIVAVPTSGGPAQRLDLGTVGNGDLDLVRREGALWLAWVAQGFTSDAERAFRRLFAAPLELDPRP